MENLGLFMVFTAQENPHWHNHRIQSYGERSIQCTFDWLLSTAEQLWQNDFSIIIVTIFLKQAHRQPIQASTRTLNIPFVIASCSVKEKQLYGWIKKLTTEGTVASETTIEVMLRQLATKEPPSTNEADHIINTNSRAEKTNAQLVSAVSQIQARTR